MDVLTSGDGMQPLVTRRKAAFVVIGKEGSTADGEGFVQRLWAEANAHFDEIAPLARRDADGQLVGIWGAMSDVARRFRPWEDDFRRGLYLAGVECVDGAQAPAGWTRWTIPGYEYVVVEDHPGAFAQTLARLTAQGMAMVGAVQEFTDPATGRQSLWFPIGEG